MKKREIQIYANRNEYRMEVSGAKLSLRIFFSLPIKFRGSLMKISQKEERVSSTNVCTAGTRGLWVWSSNFLTMLEYSRNIHLGNQFLKKKWKVSRLNLRRKSKSIKRRIKIERKREKKSKFESLMWNHSRQGGSWISDSNWCKLNVLPRTSEMRMKKEKKKANYVSQCRSRSTWTCV